MSNWSTDKIKFMFIEDFNRDIGYEELKKLVEDFKVVVQSYFPLYIENRDELIKHDEILFEPDSVHGGHPQPVIPEKNPNVCMGEPDEGYLVLDNGTKSRYLSYAIEYTYNAAHRASSNCSLITNLLDDFKPDNDIEFITEALRLTFIANKLQCVIEKCWLSESSSFCTTRWIYGPNCKAANPWHEAKQTMNENGDIQPADIKTNPTLAHVIGEHYAVCAMECDLEPRIKDNEFMAWIRKNAKLDREMEKAAATK